MRIPFLDEMTEFRIGKVPIGAAFLLKVFEGFNDGIGQWVASLVEKKFGAGGRAYHGAKVATPIALAMLFENIGAIKRFVGEATTDVFALAGSGNGLNYLPGLVKGAAAPSIEAYISTKLTNLLGQIGGTPQVAGGSEVSGVPQEYQEETSEIVGSPETGGGVGYVSEVERRAKLTLAKL